MITVEDLTKKRALRRFSDFRNPKILPFGSLEFPRKPLIHVQPVDKDDIGFTPTHSLINCFDVDEDLYVNQVTSFGVQVPKGFFENTARDKDGKVRAYFKRYPTLNRVFKLETAMSSTFPIIQNYGLLGSIWYRPSQKTTNASLIWNTTLYTSVLQHSCNLASFNRPNFIIYDLPEILPELNLITGFLQKEDLFSYRKYFSSYKMHAILSLMFWFTNTEHLNTRVITNTKLHDRLTGFIILRDGENSLLLSVDKLKEWRVDGSSTPTNRYKDFYRLLESFVERRVSIDETEHGDLIKEENGNEITGVQTKDSVSSESSKAKPTQDPSVSSDVELVDNTEYTKIIKKQAEIGQLTTANYNRLLKKADRYRTIPNPVGEGTLADLLKDNPENWQANPRTYHENKVIKHKSWLQDNITDLDANYMEKQFETDLASMAMMIQAAGYPVTGYTKEISKDAMSNTAIYRVKVEPAKGSSSTLPAKIPVIDRNGEFITDGNKMRLDRQIAEKPIVKIAPTEVNLISEMCKLAITRCSRSNFNYRTWLCKRINLLEVEGKLQTVASSNFSHDVRAPYHYTMLTHEFAKIETKEYSLDFTAHRNKDKLDFSDGIVFGKTKNGLLVKMLPDNSISLLDKKGNEKHVGNICTILGVDDSKAPNEFATLVLWRKEVPVGVYLAYLLGLDTFFSRIGVSYIIKERQERHVLTDNEYIVKFKDKQLIAKPETCTQKLLVHGFDYYKNKLPEYRYSDFKERGGFTGIFNSRGVSPDHVMELDLLETNFIDPITKKLLGEMNEPTEYHKLLVRAVALLEYELHRKPGDGYNYIDKGYSRVCGIVYREWLQGIRSFRRAGVRDTNKISISPYAVHQKIVEDAAGTLIEEINPLHSTTEKERCTFNGGGGRKPDVVTGELRTFSVNDIGRVSEANVDNGTVGTTRWTSSNPRYKNAYGMCETYAENQDVDAANVLSPCAMVMPYSMHDD